MGSDKISSIEEPVVTVKLDIRDGDINGSAETLEFNSQQLDQFIETLDSAQKVSKERCQFVLE